MGIKDKLLIHQFVCLLIVLLNSEVAFHHCVVFSLHLFHYLFQCLHSLILHFQQLWNSHDHFWGSHWHWHLLQLLQIFQSWMIYMVQIYKYELCSLSKDHDNLISNYTKFEFFNPRNVFPRCVISFVFVRQTSVLIFSACNSGLNIQTDFSINIQLCLT